MVGGTNVGQPRSDVGESRSADLWTWPRGHGSANRDVLLTTCVARVRPEGSSPPWPTTQSDLLRRFPGAVRIAPILRGCVFGLGRRERVIALSEAFVALLSLPRSNRSIDRPFLIAVHRVTGICKR